MAISQYTFDGNVTRDPEMRFAGDTPVLNFDVAVNHRKDEDPTYVRCALFGKRAEKLQQYIEKGTGVIITGELRNRAYEKDGEKRRSLEVRVGDLSFKGGKPSGGGDKPAPKKSSGGDDGVYDDDLPF